MYEITKSHYYANGGDANEMQARVWRENCFGKYGWHYFRFYDGQ